SLFFSVLPCPPALLATQAHHWFGVFEKQKRSARHQSSRAKTCIGVYLQTGTVSNPRTLSRVQKRQTALKGGPSSGRVWWIGETSAPCLNNRSFALAHWSLALADASGKTKSEKH